MGLFNNNNGKDNITKIAKEMLRSATDVNEEIGNVLSVFLNNHDQYENICEDMVAFTKQIATKLDSSEKSQLDKLNESLCDLHEDYLTSMRMVSSISEKQALRIKKARAIY